MVLSVIGLSAAAYIFSLLRFREKWILQQIVFLIIFLTGLTIVGNLDILLPVYFLFSLSPFIPKLRKISRFTGTLAIYYLVYLYYGLVSQNITATLVTFIAKMWQFMIFFLVYDSAVRIRETDYQKPIRAAVTAESLLGLYLLFTGPKAENGLIRLVSNSQPISGNLSTAVLPLTAYYYIKNRNDSKKIQWLFCMNLVMLLWIVLSGTRGYALEALAPLALIFFDYCTGRRAGRTPNRAGIITIFGLSAGVLALLLVFPVIPEAITSILRLNIPMGIRANENAASREFMRNASLQAVVVGIGLGGTGGSYSEMADALTRQFSLGLFGKTYYLQHSGAIFHNLYANWLMCLGVLGAVVLVWLNITIWVRTARSCGNQVLLKWILHIYHLNFLWMNYFRWSAVCGIGEMIIFALILKRVEQDRNLSGSGARNARSSA